MQGADRPRGARPHAAPPRGAVSVAIGLGLVPACCAVLAFSSALAAHQPDRSGAGDLAGGGQPARSRGPLLSGGPVLSRGAVLSPGPVPSRNPVVGRDPAAYRAIASLRLRAEYCRSDRPAALLTAPVLAGRDPVKGCFDLG